MHMHVCTVLFIHYYYYSDRGGRVIGHSSSPIANNNMCNKCRSNNFLHTTVFYLL